MDDELEKLTVICIKKTKKKQENHSRLIRMISSLELYETIPISSWPNKLKTRTLSRKLSNNKT